MSNQRRLRPILSGLVVAMPLGMLIGSGAGAGAQTMELRGHSIVATYAETVRSRRGTARMVWTEKIYVSSKGRIFAKHDIRSDDSDRNRQFEASPDSSNGGGGSNFELGASGLSRQWTSGRGNRIRQTITISGRPGAFQCRMVISRARGSSTVESQTCRVSEGNVLAN